MFFHSTTLPLFNVLSITSVAALESLRDGGCELCCSSDDDNHQTSLLFQHSCLFQRRARTSELLESHTPRHICPSLSRVTVNVSVPASVSLHDIFFFFLPSRLYPQQTSLPESFLWIHKWFMVMFCFFFVLFCFYLFVGSVTMWTNFRNVLHCCFIIFRGKKKKRW